MIWILTAGFGDGHNAAARGVRDALLERHVGGELLMEDWLLRQQPLAARLSMAAYRQVIVHCPGLWGAAYKRLELSPEKALHPGLIAFLQGRLEADLARLRPEVIVSTYPLYSCLLQAVRSSGVKVPPLLTVVTDAATIHPTWFFAPSDAYAVIDGASAAVLEKAGIARQRIAVTGFPVGLEYLQAFEREDISPAVLYLPSTTGGQVERTLAGLLPTMRSGVRVTVVLGRHKERLHHRVQRFVDANEDLPLVVHGWRDDMPKMIRQHDLVITKAGGAIVHEIMAARVPAILDYVVPGQEEGNAEELVRAGGGVLGQTPEQTAALAAELMAAGNLRLHEMKAALNRVSRPDAALLVADEVVRLMGPR